jgi:hypothetical protein
VKGQVARRETLTTHPKGRGLRIFIESDRSA